MKFDTEWKDSKDWTGQRKFVQRTSTQWILTEIQDEKILYTMEHEPENAEPTIYHVHPETRSRVEAWYRCGKIKVGHLHAVTMVKPAGETKMNNVRWIDCDVVADLRKQQAQDETKGGLLEF